MQTDDEVGGTTNGKEKRERNCFTRLVYLKLIKLITKYVAGNGKEVD